MDPWVAEGTDVDYYVPYTSLNRVENSVIDFDVENIRDVLDLKHKDNAFNIAKRINSHYLNSMRHEKRAFGNGRVDDYQSYNWGLALSVEMGLIADQTELLMSFYTSTIEDRLTEKEVETILILHTNFKSIPNSLSQQRKWRDMKKSWKLLAVKIDGYPPTISKKDFMRSLDVNFIDFEVNIERLSRDMQSVDYDAAYLHSLLLDDPLLRGELPPPKKDFCLLPKSRRKNYHGQPRGGDDDVSIAQFTELLREEEEEEERGDGVEEGLNQNDSEDKEATRVLQSRLDKRKAADEEAKQRQLDRQREVQLVRESELARREFEESAMDDLAQQVQRIRAERRAEKAVQHKKERAALVRSSAKPLGGAGAGGRQATAEVSVTLHAPDVAQASELKPPPLAYRPPSPTAPLPPSQRNRSSDKRMQEDVPGGKQARRRKGKPGPEQQHDGQVEAERLPEQEQKEEEEAFPEPEKVADDFLYEPGMDDDEYFIGAMADESILSLLEDPTFLLELIRDTIQPPPPSAEEEAQWRRQAAQRRADAERVRKEEGYVEGLCEEAVDGCLQRLGDEQLDAGLLQWRREDEATDDALAETLQGLLLELLGSGAVEMHREQQTDALVAAAVERIFSGKFEALLGVHVQQVARERLAEEVAEAALTRLLEPFIEAVVMDRLQHSLKARLEVGYTKEVMARKAAEKELREEEQRRQQEEAAERKREAAEKKARQLAVSKEEAARLKAEKKQRDLERLAEMERSAAEKKERARRVAAGEIEEKEKQEAEKVKADKEKVEGEAEAEAEAEAGAENELQGAETTSLKLGSGSEEGSREPQGEEIGHEHEEENEERVQGKEEEEGEDLPHCLTHAQPPLAQEQQQEAQQQEREDQEEVCESSLDVAGEAAQRQEAGQRAISDNTSMPLALPPRDTRHQDDLINVDEELMGSAVHRVEEDLWEELCQEALRETSRRVLSGESEQGVREAVQALLSDKLHLDLQRLMASSSLLPDPPLTPALFEVTEAVAQPSCFPSLHDLYTLPFSDYRFNVPKTNGQLRVHIRHDDEGEVSGLFVHGFKSYSAAEEQGLLRVGDELLELNHVPMEGCGLLAVIEALEGHQEPFVTIVVRRHEVEGGLLSGTITPRFSQSAWGGSPRGHVSPLGVGSLLLKSAGGSAESLASSSSFLRGMPDTSPRPFVVAQTTQRPEAFPALEELLQLPSQDLRFVVPKTNGQLRIELRHDDDGETNGIFIHGFRPFSEAKKQGLLKVGDELLELEGVDVCGCDLEDVIRVLAEHHGDDVEMLVCRRDALQQLEQCSEFFSQPGASSRRGSARSVQRSPRPLEPARSSRQEEEGGSDLQWEDIVEDDDSQSSMSAAQRGLLVGEQAFSLSSYGSRSLQEGQDRQDGLLLDREDNGSLAASMDGLEMQHAAELLPLGLGLGAQAWGPDQQNKQPVAKPPPQQQQQQQQQQRQQQPQRQQQQLLAKLPQPVVKQQEPVAMQQPVAKLPQPVVKQQEPVAMQQPVAKLPHPVVKQQEPVAMQQPVAKLPQPVVKQPQLLTTSASVIKKRGDNESKKEQEQHKPSGLMRFFSKKQSAPTPPAATSSTPSVSASDPPSKGASGGGSGQKALNPGDSERKEDSSLGNPSVRILKMPPADSSSSSPARASASAVSGGGAVGLSSAPSTARLAKSQVPDMHSYSEELVLDVPRTEDQLRIMIKRFSDDASGQRGFYIHGFQPMCRAEGVLLAGDVVLEVGGQAVAGATLKGVARIIAGAEGPSVRFKVKRTVTVSVQK